MATPAMPFIGARRVTEAAGPPRRLCRNGHMVGDAVTSAEALNGESIEPPTTAGVSRPHRLLLHRRPRRHLGSGSSYRAHKPALARWVMAMAGVKAAGSRAQGPLYWSLAHQAVHRS
jgi:hypothetical protein